MVSTTTIIIIIIVRFKIRTCMIDVLYYAFSKIFVQIRNVQFYDLIKIFSNDLQFN